MSIRERLRLRERKWLWPAIDLLTAAPTAVAAAQLRLVRRLGIRELPMSRRILQRVGLLPVAHHYYEPFVLPGDLLRDLDAVRTLPGVELDETAMWALLERVIPPTADESLSAPETAYDSKNGTYGLGDARPLYALLRWLKPANVFEVGSGNSTRVAMAALHQNRAEGSACRHLCIEPYEMPWLDQSGVDLVRQRVETLDPTMFEQLERGDVLFIDNSHIIKPQGDVLYLFQEVLPRLQSGVWVHIHDIFTPRDYPAHWLFDKMLLWNEQYLLEVLIAGGGFEVRLALNHLCQTDTARYEQVVGPSGMQPTAFWIEKR